MNLNEMILAFFFDVVEDFLLILLILSFSFSSSSSSKIIFGESKKPKSDNALKMSVLNVKLFLSYFSSLIMITDRLFENLMKLSCS